MSVCGVGLTVLLGKFSRLVHKSNFVVTEICERPQILVLALVRKWIPTLVAVVKVGEKNVCPCSI